MPEAAVEQRAAFSGMPVYQQSDWLDRFPTLFQGITGRAPGLDFGSADSVSRSDDRAYSSSTGKSGWDLLRQHSGILRVIRCRQVHGAAVARYEGNQAGGAVVLGDADALVTNQRGALLAVTVADCVPVYLVDPAHGILGLAHAGWRGAAAGVAPETVADMRSLGADLTMLYAHLGPAICGDCYEVGPEVSAAFGERPMARRAFDLRARIATQLESEGLRARNITTSRLCTRCGDRAFYSYRGGDRGRRMCA
ncbi:MAG: polyphenol oxidase family protein, partial [Gemmatimonadota bacterium]